MVHDSGREQLVVCTAPQDKWAGRAATAANVKLVCTAQRGEGAATAMGIPLEMGPRSWAGWGTAAQDPCDRSS